MKIIVNYVSSRSVIPMRAPLGRALTLGCLALSLTGCGIGDHFNAQNRMDQAEQDYRACLNANVKNPTVCDPLKEVWQTDKAAYDAGNY